MINNQSEYLNAIRELDEMLLKEPPQGSPEFNKMIALSDQINDYEDSIAPTPPKEDFKVIKEEQLSPQQEMQERVDQIVGYLRQKERQAKGFGLQILDEIAVDSGMRDEIKAKIKEAVLDPKKTVTITFHPNTEK